MVAFHQLFRAIVRRLRSWAPRRLNGLNALVGELRGDGRAEVAADGQTVDIRAPMEFRVRSGRKEIVLPEGATTEPAAQRNRPLMLAIAEAHRWQRMIESGEVSGMEELAKRVGVDRSYVARLLQLTSLAPEFVQAIVAGREPSGMSLGELKRGFPMRWDEQRTLWSQG